MVYMKTKNINMVRVVSIITLCSLEIGIEFILWIWKSYSDIGKFF